VENISPRCVVAMYIEKEFIKEYVKALKPSTLEDAIQQGKAYSEVVRS
jgi:hypothetical protein